MGSDIVMHNIMDMDIKEKKRTPKQRHSEIKQEKRTGIRFAQYETKPTKQLSQKTEKRENKKNLGA